jgi:hypothetical protein
MNATNCKHCGTAITDAKPTGRSKKYCGNRCLQRAAHERRKARKAGMTSGKYPPVDPVAIPGSRVVSRGDAA